MSAQSSEIGQHPEKSGQITGPQRFQAAARDVIFKAGYELVLQVLHTFWFFKTMSVCRKNKKHVESETWVSQTQGLHLENLYTRQIVFPVIQYFWSGRVSRVNAATLEQFLCFKCKPLLCLSLVCCDIYEILSSLYTSLCYSLSYTCHVNPVVCVCLGLSTPVKSDSLCKLLSQLHESNSGSDLNQKGEKHPI